MIKAEIVADSLSPQGDRLVSVLCTFPRIILAEINTHRMLSKNTASSRAIPFFKMVQSVYDNPYIPIAWQKHHAGMQGSEYVPVNTIITVSEFVEDFITIVRNKAIEDKVKETKEFNNMLYHMKIAYTEMFGQADDNHTIKTLWLKARDCSATLATMLYTMGGVTKQLCNRLLEPFMWTTMLITGPMEQGWDNFFELRCPKYQSVIDDFGVQHFKSKKDLINAVHESELPYYNKYTTIDWLKENKGAAEIHMMALAECIYDAFNESTPKQLKAGEWHIPFDNEIVKLISDVNSKDFDMDLDYSMTRVKISTSMAARTSYTIVGEEKQTSIKDQFLLHDRLVAQNPPHSSPMEHCAKCMNKVQYVTNVKGELAIDENSSIVDQILTDNKSVGWCRNFKGFISYRHIIENAGN